MTVARPDKTVGRVILGPRLVGAGYARIVARADGSGRIELYDRRSGLWQDALEQCTFAEVWSAPTATDAKHLALLKSLRKAISLHGIQLLWEHAPRVIRYPWPHICQPMA